MSKTHLTYDELFCRAKNLPLAGKRLYGVPNGGTFAALIANVKHPTARIVDKPEDADVIIDDVIDSGATMWRYTQSHPGRPFYALVDKTNGDGHWKGRWLVFPWEAADDSSAEDNVRRLIQLVDTDPDREGLKETPARVVKAFKELCSGYDQDPAAVLKTFTDGAEGYDELVILKDIEFVSCCEHHMLPFLGVAHVGYIPDGRIVGLSKLARLLEVYSRRLQVQERLTTQITQALDEHLRPKGSACVVEARHMCMSCRGVKKQNATMITSSLTGAFRNEPETRSEFLRLIGK